MRDKALNIISILLFGGGLLCFAYVFWNNFKSDEISSETVTDCVTKRLIRRVADNHMAGFLNAGEEYNVLVGYYDCAPVTRDAPVWFEISSALAPVVRFVRGLPGDRFSIEKDPDNKGHWFVKINGGYIQHEDSRYFFKHNTLPPLKTYEQARGGRLRKNEFLVFSNRPPGFSDSGNLGLIQKKSILGHVTKVK